MLSEYFDTVSNESDWITAGEDVQYKVIDRVLYFQCSRGASDWRHNFDVARNVYDKSDVRFVMHRGFARLWLSVKPIIEVMDFDTIVGYSQGAALAIAAHENYFHRNGIEPATYTFGCSASIWFPGRQLRARFTRVFNFINPRDIVYYCALVLGYRHVGMKARLPRVTVSPKPRFRDTLADMSNHTPERYHLALKGS